MTIQEIENQIIDLEQRIMLLQHMNIVEQDAHSLLHKALELKDIEEFTIKKIELCISQALWLQNQLQPSLDLGLTILKWSENYDNVPFLIKNLANCGTIYRLMDLLSESMAVFQRALELSHHSGYKKFLSNILSGIAKIYHRQYQNEKALDYMHQALQFEEENNNYSRIASWSGSIGIIYDDMGEFTKAVEYYLKALEASKLINNNRSIALWSGNLAISYQNLSEYGLALEYYRIALQINEQENETDSIALNISNMGNVYFCLEEYNKALEYYNKALSLHEEVDYKQGIADTTGNIASIYLMLKDYPLSIEFFRRNIAINEELGNLRGIANNTGNLGNVYLAMGEFEMAVECFTKALQIDQHTGNRNGWALWYGSLGRTYADKNYESYNPDLALEYLNKALSLAIELGIRKEEFEFHRNIAELYYQNENWKEYAMHYKLYRDIQQEVLSEESKQLAAKLDYERRLAEREKQIAVEKAASQARIEEQHKLILNVLPVTIAERLLSRETFIVDHYDNVSTLFMDLVNFTKIASVMPPKQLIYLLNTIFSAADAVMQKHGLEKIKTIGDAYMAVAGAPVQKHDHAIRAGAAALDLLVAMEQLTIIMPKELGDSSWVQSTGDIQVRIGLHCGEAIGGVIGDTKFTFDLWGDAINTAARMESHGLPGKIHISDDFRRQIIHCKDFNCIPRGPVDIKGKGMMNTYFLERAE
jgi:class 3 adenylate cyclase/Tfp pilus assembly protein PilF